MHKVIYESNSFVFYTEESMFEKGKFREISEEYFDNTVVKFRNQYDLKYCDGYQEFTDKKTGLRTRRYYNTKVYMI